MAFSFGPYDLLICNIELIGYVLPIPGGVHEVLMKGMFDKPNKKGFMELAYFLFNILNPERLKALIIWPCLCKKDEMKFRVGVSKLVAEINEDSKCNILRRLNPSEIIAACGPKVVEFMSKLSFYTLKIICERNLGIEVPCYIDPSTLPPLGKKLRLKMMRTSLCLNINKVRDSLISCKKHTNSSLAEIRKLNDEILKIEFERKEEELQLQNLIKGIEIEQSLKTKLMNPNQIDVCIKDWSKKNELDIKNLYPDIQIVSDFVHETGYTYNIMRDVVAVKNGVKLDGRRLKVPCPSSLNNQLVLYDGFNNLILENFLKSGFKIVELHLQKLVSINLSDHLKYMLPISGLVHDVVQYNERFNGILFDFYLLRSNTKQSNILIKYTDGSCYDSPLTRHVSHAQSPPIVLNNFDGSLSTIGLQQKKGSRRLLNWIVHRVNEKNKITDSNKNESSQKNLSRLKQPKKITAYGSSSKYNINLKIKEVDSPSVKPKCGSDIVVSPMKTTNKENVTPKRVVDKFGYKTPITPKGSFDFSSKSIETSPKRRISMYALSNDRKKRNFKQKVCKSLSLEEIKEDGSCVYENQKCDVLPSLPSTSCASFVEVDNIFKNNLEDLDLMNLSRETAPSETDSSDGSVPSTPSPVVKPKACKETSNSPLGIIDRHENKKKKNAKFQPNLKAIINRFNEIKGRQEVEPLVHNSLKE